MVLFICYFFLGKGLHHCFQIDETENCKFVKINPLIPNADIKEYTVDVFYRISKMTGNPGIASFASSRSDDEFALLLKLGTRIEEYLFTGLSPKYLIFERMTVVKNGTDFKLYIDGKLMVEKEVIDDDGLSSQVQAELEVER